MIRCSNADLLQVMIQPRVTLENRNLSEKDSWQSALSSQLSAIQRAPTIPGITLAGLRTEQLRIHRASHVSWQHLWIYSGMYFWANGKKKRQQNMADTTDLFIHRTLNIIHAMKNIFLLSQKTSVPFLLSAQMSKLVPFEKACNSNRFSLKERFTKVVLNYSLRKISPHFFHSFAPWM